MVTDPQPVGLDLARIALRAAKEDARRRGNRPVSDREKRARGGRRMAGHGSDREPKPMSLVVPGLVTARGWERPAAGGTALDRWPAAVGPDRAKHWTAEHYNPDERVLHVRADSPGWATTLRLSKPQILEALAAEVGPDAVRDIRVRVGGRQAGAIPAPDGAAGSIPAGPTEEDAAEAVSKFRAALPAAYLEQRAAAPPRPEPAPAPPNPFLPPEYGRLGREPEDALPDAVHAREREQARARDRTRDGIPYAAIARARADRAARPKT